VPFGPRARKGGDESREDVGDDEAEHLAPPPLDPNGFWGEEASSIQDVVEVPVRSAIEGQNWRRLAVPNRVVASALAIGLMASAGLVAWQLSGSSPRTVEPAIAANGQYPEPRTRTGAVEAAAAREVSRNPPRHPVTRRQHSRASAPRPAPTAVVYHPGQAAYSAPQAGSYNPPASSSTSAVQGQGTSGAGASSASAQPAFGTNGALGPISSPAG
jgi:hypothetical protein